MPKRKHSEIEGVTPAERKSKKAKHVGNEDKEANLSQFQTDTRVAEKVYNEAQAFLPPNPMFVEPSAGGGAFYNLLPADRRIGIDIDTTLEDKFPEYIYADFLTLDRSKLGLDAHDRKNIVIIGNPPFSLRKSLKRNEHGTSMGGSVNLALKFVNHAAKISDTICFIVGCNFRKSSIKDKIDSELHLVHEQVINGAWQEGITAAFQIVGQGKAVKTVNTVFQIWQRKYAADGTAIKRVKNFGHGIKVIDGKWSKDDVDGDFTFLKKGDPLTKVIIRKWGSKKRIGDVVKELDAIKEKLAPRGVGGRTSGTWFCLDAQDPASVATKLESKKDAIMAYCKDTSTVPSATLNMKDLITIYTS